MRKVFQFGLISIACAATYLGLRSLPVEPCEFLHYGEFVNDQGVIEGCGYEESDFFVMSELRFPIIATLTPLGPLRVGATQQIKLTLFTTTGRPIAWEDIAVSHTERIHAMLIDSSLNDYHHLHPQPAGPQGHFLFDFTPRAHGQYSVYLDFIPLINSRRTLLSATLQVEGPDAAPQLAHRLSAEDSAFHFKLACLNTERLTGMPLHFEFTARRKDGGTPLFAPVMGSFAHAVAFDTQRTGFAHLHPLNPFITGQNPNAPDLRFEFEFSNPGTYRVWVQVILDGQERFIPFDLEVNAPTHLAAAAL